MHRTENIGDAITNDEAGNPVGTYKDFQLRSAYQPIYTINSLTRAELSGFEGLVRPSKNGKDADAASFLNEIVPEDRVFIECMCMALHIRNYGLCSTKDKTLFLNINVANYPSVDVVEAEIFYTFSQLSKYGLSKDKVVFEIHNTAVVAPFVLVRICELFRSNGFRFALDDFGVGHSNIERYLMLRPDIIKINRSLFVDARHLRRVEKLLAALISGFRDNGAQVLMEGLESEAELMSAMDMEVNMVQGYHLAKPQLQPVKFEEKIEIARTLNIPNLELVAIP